MWVLNRILLKTHSNLKKIFFYDPFLVFFSQTPFIFSKNMCYDQILVISVVTHVIFVKNDPKPSKMEVYCTSIQKIGVRPPPKGGGSLGKQYYYWFFGGPWPPLLGAIFTVIPFKILFLMIKWPFLNGVTMKMTPLRVNFHCNTIQNIVFNDQMIIFEWFYNENDPLGGSIFTVMPFKNIVFNDQRPFFEWCYNENDPPPGGSKWPLLGGVPHSMGL